VFIYLIIQINLFIINILFLIITFPPIESFSPVPILYIPPLFEDIYKYKYVPSVAIELF